jgi:ankyrin repeat protein
MSQKPPTRAMRENPDIDQLKRQAKELLEAYRVSAAEAVAEVTAYHHTADPETFALHDAQFVLARSYGFESWPKLKAAVDGVTAAKLYEAVESADLNRVRELLTRRPEIVDRGRRMSPLNLAVQRRDLGMTKLLLEFGADPDAGIWPYRDATSPRAMARDRGYQEISDAINAALEKRGASPSQVPLEVRRKVREAQLSGREEAMVAVINEHPGLADWRHADGTTMLHLAAGRGETLIVKWLLDHGKDVNARARGVPHQSATFLDRSPQGWTPLDFAATGRGSDEWLFNNDRFQQAGKLLLERGAELSPLSAAALGRWDYLEKFSKQQLEGKGVLEAAVRGDQPDTLRRLLDLSLDPDEPIQVGHMEEKTWSSGGPVFQAVVLNRIGMARLLLERGGDPNANVFTAGSAAYRAYDSGNPELIGLMEKYGGWIDAGAAGYARQTEMARKMLAGEIDPHLEPSDFMGHTIAEQLLWGGASSLCDDIVRMALERVDWSPDDPRWFGMLRRPTWNNAHRPECCDTLRLILARTTPHHRDPAHGQTILHEVVADDRGQGLQLAIILLDAGARLDVRDDLLKSTPLGWACRWGRIEIVKLFLVRGADPAEADAEAWARPGGWAEKMHYPEIVELLKTAKPNVSL